MSFLINPYRFGSAYDADYQALLDYYTANSLSHPSPAKKTVENAFMIAVKAAFGQSTIAACPILQMLMFKTDAASGASLVNWHNPGTRNATAVNSPTHTSDLGWNSDGAASYIDSNLGATTLNQNNFSILARSFINAQETSFSLGVRDSNGGTNECLQFNPRTTGDQAQFKFFDNTTATTNVSETDATQRWAFGRTNNANVHYAINGAAFTSVAKNVNPAENANTIYLLAVNNVTGAASFSTRGLSYYIISSRKLTDGENAAIDAAIVNYLA